MCSSSVKFIHVGTPHLDLNRKHNRKTKLTSATVNVISLYDLTSLTRY